MHNSGVRTILFSMLTLLINCTDLKQNVKLSLPMVLKIDYRLIEFRKRRFDFCVYMELLSVLCRFHLCESEQHSTNTNQY